MKRLLKPTGQILTTAVLTSTAIDACFPQTANPVPLDSSSPETTPTPEQPTIDASDIVEQGSDTVAPPEAVSAHTGLASSAPHRQEYADLPAPLPAEFFADLEKNNTPQRPLTAEAIRQQQVATAQPPNLNQDIQSESVISTQATAQSIDQVTTQAITSPQDEGSLAAVIPTVQVFMPEESYEGAQPVPSSPSEVNGSESRYSGPISIVSQNSEATSENDIANITAVSIESPEPGSIVSNTNRSTPISIPNHQAPQSPSIVEKAVAEEVEELPPLALPSNTAVVTRPAPSEAESSIAPNETEDLIAEIEVTLISPDGSQTEQETHLESLLSTQGDEGDRLDADISLSTEPPIGSEAIAPDANPIMNGTNGTNGTNDVTSSSELAHEIDVPSPTNNGLQNTNEPQDIDDLQDTRNWLDAQLALIVDQSRQRQAGESRQRLIEFARQSLELGNITEARRVADNPMLTEEEQEALRVAIAETSSQEFIPLIPLPNDANGDLGLVGIQPNLPSLEALPTLPTTPLSTPHPLQEGTAIASLSDQLPSLPLSSVGLHQWPLSNAGLPPASSLTAEELKRCLVGDGDINVDDPHFLISSRTSDITDGASPRISTNSSSLEPMAYIGTGQQPPTSLKSSDAFPVGGDFLAGVGQQPPSILPESSWSGAPVLSDDPVPFRWTRSKLNQELKELQGQINGTDPASKTLSSDCREILAHREQRNIGGPTVAALTGYEWLSQFAIARPSSSSLSFSQRQPTQMILPLPHATPMTSGFGWRTHPIYGGRRFHFGLDYGAPSGTPILASISGRIETTGSLNGYGLTVVLENDDLKMRNLYAHMSGIAVEEGTWVEQGTVIGWVGSTGNSTGPHLHFEVHKQSQDGWVAVDPLQAAAELIQLAKR